MQQRQWAALLLMLSLCMGIVVGEAGRGHAQSPPFLVPDLSFHFICQVEVRWMLESKIEDFLNREGFKVLNQARLGRERGVANLEVFIVGFDDQRRTFRFNALPRTDGRYAVSFTTPPPTIRSPSLEDAVLNLISKELGCKLRQVMRGENGMEMREAFDRHYRFIQELFEKAAGQIRL